MQPAHGPSSVAGSSRHVRAAKVDLVCLAGFLQLIEVPDDYAGRVMNIHPSLIPAFCGHGYYGHHVHEAVLAYGAKITGCTVHFADNQYDHGPIVLQRAVPVLDDDTPETLAARVFAAECEAYPEAIRLFGEGKLGMEGRRIWFASQAQSECRAEATFFPGISAAAIVAIPGKSVASAPFIPALRPTSLCCSGKVLTMQRQFSPRRRERRKKLHAAMRHCRKTGV